MRNEDDTVMESKTESDASCKRDASEQSATESESDVQGEATPALSKKRATARKQVDEVG